MTLSASNVHHIRELRNQYPDRVAVILAKGPSLDAWYDRGEHLDRPADQLIFAVNETAILPGLAPDFWFWTNADHYHWEKAVEGFSPDIPQVVPEPVSRQLTLESTGRPTWIFLRGVEAEGDPYAVPGVGTPAAAAFFCSGLWGCRQVLAVGFDAMENDNMRTYAACLTPWLIERQAAQGFRMNNQAQQGIIDDLHLDVVYYHRTIPAAEVEASHQKFRDRYGPVVPMFEQK